MLLGFSSQALKLPCALCCPRESKTFLTDLVFVPEPPDSVSLLDDQDRRVEGSVPNLHLVLPASEEIVRGQADHIFSGKGDLTVQNDIKSVQNGKWM